MKGPVSAALRNMVASGVQALRSPSLRRAGIYVASALTSALIPFLLLPVLARALGPIGYGYIGAFTGMVTIASVLVGASTHGILAATYFRVAEEQFQRYLSACIWVAAISAPTFWLMAMALGPWLERATGIASVWYWALIGAALGQFLLSVALATCQVRGQARRFAALQIGNSALNLSLTIALVIGLSFGWEGRAIAQCVATLSIGLAGLIIVNRGVRRALATDRRSVSSTLKFGVPLVPHSLAAAVMSSADRLILISVVGAATAGQYFAAFQVAGVITLTSSAINQAMSPWLFRSLNLTDPGARVRVVRVTYLVLALLVAQGATVALLADPLMRLVGGAAFAESAPLVRILTIAMTCNGAYYLFVNYIFHTHKTHWLSLVTVSISLLQIGVTIVAARLFGATGAAWASVGVNLCYVVAVWIVAARLVPMPWFGARRTS